MHRIREAIAGGGDGPKANVAPVDLRYLQKGVPKRGQNLESDNPRAQVVTFLRGVYESIAETLPDVRDEGCEDGLEGDERFSVNLPQADVDPYTHAMTDPMVRLKLKPKGRGIQVRRHGLRLNVQRRPEHGLEKRWLPPGSMREYYDQFLCTPDSKANGKQISFATFWRAWHEEFGLVLQFRPTSSHAVCATCTRHKLLIRGFAGHMRARQAQIEHFAAHLQSQYLDRLCYRDARAQSRLQGSFEVLLIIDGMDQAKFQYPRSDLFRSKELNTFVRPRAHISGAILHGHAIVFAVSPSDLRKDANSSIELVAYCLQVLSRKVDLKKATLTVQSDNTSREIKNNHTIRFLASLVSHGC